MLFEVRGHLHSTITKALATMDRDLNETGKWERGGDLKYMLGKRYLREGRTGGGSFNGHAIAGIAVFALKGPIFFTFSDVTFDHPAATTAAMQGQAQTVLTRLP